MCLETIINNLNVIKKNLPKYKGKYPEVETAMRKKQAELEILFHERIEELRYNEGCSQTYKKYHNWYLRYKNIEAL